MKLQPHWTESEGGSKVQWDHKEQVCPAPSLLFTCEAVMRLNVELVGKQFMLLVCFASPTLQRL